MERGTLISLEGIDGVGKTTCAKILCERLNTKGKEYRYVNRKEIPSTTPYIKAHMENLYAIMWGQGEVFSRSPDIPYNGLTKEHWRHLMLAWYSAFEQHLILPILEKGVSIITDGYIHKEITKAIHSTGDFSTAEQFNFLHKPDIVIYLTASPEDCIRDDSYTNRVESGMFVGNQSNFVKHQDSMNVIYDKFSLEDKWIKVVRNNDINKTCTDIIRALGTTFLV